MGIDLLDLAFRVERVFKIKLDAVTYIERAKSFSLKHKRIDIQVCDFVRIVESAIKDQNSTFEGDLFELLRPHIAECLCRQESEVTADAWMIHDLGME